MKIIYLVDLVNPVILSKIYHFTHTIHYRAQLLLSKIKNKGREEMRPKIDQDFFEFFSSHSIFYAHPTERRCSISYRKNAKAPPANAVISWGVDIMAMNA